MRITATRAPANCVQLACLDLFLHSTMGQHQPPAGPQGSLPARSDAAAAAAPASPPLVEHAGRENRDLPSSAQPALPEAMGQLKLIPIERSSPGQEPAVDQDTAELAQLQPAESGSLQPAEAGSAEQDSAMQHQAGRKLVPGRRTAEPPGSSAEQLAAEIRRLFALFREQGLEPNVAAAKALTEAQAQAVKQPP